MGLRITISDSALQDEIILENQMEPRNTRTTRKQNGLESMIDSPDGGTPLSIQLFFLSRIWRSPRFELRFSGSSRWRCWIGNQTFRQRNQLGAASVHLPDEAAIVKLADDDAARGAAQRFHPVTRLELGGFTQALDDFDHALTVQHSGDVMGDGGRNLAFADGRKIAEQGQGQFSSDRGKRVAVEEKERGTAMEAAELIETFCER
jgi:hypothetical protein